MYTIIEPHADDSLLSMSWLLKIAQPLTVDIVTLFDNGEGSAGLKDYYPSIDTITDARIGYPCYQKDIRLYNWRDIKKKSNAFTYHEELYQKEILLMQEEAKHVQEQLQYVNTNNIIYVPFGLSHPDHVLVRTIAEQNFEHILYYLEYPYYKRNYNKKIVHDRIDTPEYIIADHVQDSNKVDYFHKLYPSQSYMMTWEYDLKDIPEYTIAGPKITL